MRSLKLKAKRYTQRKNRVASRIEGTMERPRLSVFKSNTHIYGQVIDDEKGVTLVSFSDVKVKKEKTSTDPEQGRRTKVQMADKVGEELAKLALAKKIKKVIFDRNGFRYHGRVKALADGARKGGLDF